MRHKGLVIATWAGGYDQAQLAAHSSLVSVIVV